MKNKRVLAGILAIASTAAVLSGCSGGDSSASTSGSSTASVDDSGRELVGNMYVEGLPVLKEQETYTIAISMDPNSKNTMNEKAAVQDAEKKTNIHIEWQEIPNSGWDEKVNIMIASGDLPDAFAGHVDIMKNKEAFAALNDSIENYAPNIKEMFQAMPVVQKAVTAPDGNIYTLPTNTADKSSTVYDALWINTKWLEQVGMSLPTTTDEYLNVLKAFKSQDLNGNGKADEIPLGALQGNVGSSLDPLLGPFGVTDTTDYVYMQGDNTVVFPAKLDAYYDGLQWLHELYSEGLVDPECFTMTPQAYTAKAQNPDLLYGSIMSWLPDGMDPRYGDDYVCLPPLKGPSGQTGLWTSTNKAYGEMSGFSITVNCANPEVLVRYYDNNISDLDTAMLWYEGPEGSGQWKRADGGKWEETTEFIPEGTSPSEFERTVAVGPSAPAYLWTKYTDLRVFEPRIQKKIQANDTYMQTAVQMMPVGLDDPQRVEERGILFTDIDNYMKKFKANAIVEGITKDQWADHLKSLDQLKVDQYVQLWQDYVDSKN